LFLSSRVLLFADDGKTMYGEVFSDAEEGIPCLGVGIGRLSIQLRISLSLNLGYCGMLWIPPAKRGLTVDHYHSLSGQLPSEIATILTNGHRLCRG
jgi:hypothetical protein